MARLMWLGLVLTFCGCCFSGQSPANIDAFAGGIPVEYVRDGDPRHIVLIHSDGRKVEVSYEASDDTHLSDWSNEVERTGKRRPMTMNYTLAKGVFLKDNLTGKEVRLKGVLHPHPIDIASERLEQKHGTSTVGMVITADMTTQAWKAEVERMYQVLGGDSNPRLKAAQQAWLAYRKAEVEFLSAYYGDKDGTMWSAVCSGRILYMTKQRAESLQSTYDW
jgi:uncharacterized protein YecT (DUF1311 family)